MSYPGSYAFRNGGPGMVLNTNNNQLEEPNANERERAMGFRSHTTSAPNVTEAQRRRLLGQAIDLRCLTLLLSLGLTHQQAISNPHLDLNHLGGGVHLLGISKIRFLGLSMALRVWHLIQIL